MGNARKGRTARVHSDGRIEFAPNGAAYVAWPLVAGVVVWWFVRNLMDYKRGFFELWIEACFGLCAFAVLTMFPSTVVVSGEGLEQVYWLRKNIRISWNNIVEINTGKKERTITIVAADGTKIEHSSRLADRPRLLLELRQHCGQDLPEDFPSE